MTVTTERAFWLDRDYDRANSDTGTGSRYGNYLYDRRQMFAEITSYGYDDPSVEFAATVWRIASGPIMAPAFVRSHPRIMSAALTRSHWNGELELDIEMLAPRPAYLRGVMPADGSYFRDVEFNSYADRYEGIGEEDVARAAYLTSSVRLLMQLPPGTALPIEAVRTGSGQLLSTAIGCLTRLVAEVNHQVLPVLAAMETG